VAMNARTLERVRVSAMHYAEASTAQGTLHKDVKPLWLTHVASSASQCSVRVCALLQMKTHRCEHAPQAWQRTGPGHGAAQAPTESQTTAAHGRCRRELGGHPMLCIWNNGTPSAGGVPGTNSRSGDWTHLLLSWSKDTNSQDVCTNDRDDSRTDTADEATRQHRGRQLMPQLKRSGADVVAAQQVQHLTSHGCVCSEITCACCGSSGVL
jgi:hypothetical protein